MLIRQNQVFPEYRKEVSYLAEKYDYLKSIMVDGYVDELMKIRGYVSQSQRKLITDMQLGYCTVSPLDYEEVFGVAYAKELGIITQQNNFLLDNRYIIPVEDIAGNIISMIGYFNDTRKYITLPTNFFAKDCVLFNFRQAYELSWKEYGGFVILVEGIFDCLSLRAIGLPAVATMGATVGTVKCELLKYFKKVLAIPDDDKTGHKAFTTWKLPSTSTILKFNGGVCDIGGSKLKCKDMDDFVSWYEEDDVRDILLSFKDSKQSMEEFVL